MPSKADVRRQMLDEAHLVSAHEKLHYSAQIQQHIMTLEAWSRARCVALFRAIRGEVHIEPLFAHLEAMGVRTCLPRVDGPGAMSFCPWRPGEPLVPAGLGVRQPLPDVPAVAPGGIELILVPGLAFDRSGTRLGRGAGYYDRTLPRFRATAALVGVCFAFQFMEHLPRDPWDCPMDMVVTEQGIFVPDQGPLPP
jgi:5-formyltetrahydrofolate cyclo-ligase